MWLPWVVKVKRDMVAKGMKKERVVVRKVLEEDMVPKLMHLTVSPLPVLMTLCTPTTKVEFASDGTAKLWFVEVHRTGVAGMETRLQ